jgi:hypothetical protein
MTSCHDKQQYFIGEFHLRTIQTVKKFIKSNIWKMKFGKGNYMVNLKMHDKKDEFYLPLNYLLKYQK